MDFSSISICASTSALSVAKALKTCLALASLKALKLFLSALPSSAKARTPAMVSSSLRLLAICSNSSVNASRSSNRTKAIFSRTSVVCYRNRWFIKRRLAKAITNDSINEIYDAIMASGAHGAKLCGAGDGGFFVALIPPEQRKQLEHAVAPLSVIPIDIDVDGTCLIYPSLKS